MEPSYCSNLEDAFGIEAEYKASVKVKCWARTYWDCASKMAKFRYEQKTRDPHIVFQPIDGPLKQYNWTYMLQYESETGVVSALLHKAVPFDAVHSINSTGV